MIDYNVTKIIAALWNPKKEIIELTHYPGDTVFLLRSDIVSLPGYIKKIKRKNLKVFVDIDFCEGLSSGEYAFRYLTLNGVDGVITVKPKIIEVARNFGVPSVLRSFALDSNSMRRLSDMLDSINPTFLEILPGAVFPKVKNYLVQKGYDKLKMIAAGLVKETEEAETIFKNGATAISTSERKLWKLL